MAAASQQHTAFALGRLGSGASSTFAPLGYYYQQPMNPKKKIVCKEGFIYAEKESLGRREDSQ
jgi:hypothetical protein